MHFMWLFLGTRAIVYAEFQATQSKGKYNRGGFHNKDRPTCMGDVHVHEERLRNIFREP